MTDIVMGHSGVQVDYSSYVQENASQENDTYYKPLEAKTAKLAARVKVNLEKANEATSNPTALASATSDVQDQITRRRIRNGFTPVPTEPAPESDAIAALRARLLAG
jgi:hypothetical protein